MIWPFLPPPHQENRVNKDQAYHQIALACLKTLRQTHTEATNPIDSLYQVIDQAFEEQFAIVLAELDDSKQRLEKIRSLNPTHHSLVDAHAIIDAVSNTTH